MLQWLSEFVRYTLIEYSLTLVNNAIDAASFWRQEQLHNASVNLELNLHKEDIELSEKLHMESIELAKRHHVESVEFAKKTHIREMNNALEIHYHELCADLITATRETERTMYEQRNAEFQTLIISSTVMFGALATVAVQGILPYPNPPASPGTAPSNVYEISSSACGISFLLLFLCIVLYTKIVIRTSKYMYHRAKSQCDRVYKVIEKSVEMMRNFRYKVVFVIISVSVVLRNDILEM